jgi:hypothetical protein
MTKAFLSSTLRKLALAAVPLFRPLKQKLISVDNTVGAFGILGPFLNYSGPFELVR